MIALLLASILPAWEMRTVESVAKSYCLDREQKALLVAIRRSENGTPPFYYGVANKRCNSYEKQCRWAANTIRLRYHGDIDAFGHRWCPVNANVWISNVRFFMRKQGFKK